MKDLTNKELITQCLVSAFFYKKGLDKIGKFEKYLMKQGFITKKDVKELKAERKMNKAFLKKI